jgi:hypothetical protein
VVKAQEARIVWLVRKRCPVTIYHRTEGKPLISLEAIMVKNNQAITIARTKMHKSNKMRRKMKIIEKLSIRTTITIRINIKMRKMITVLRPLKRRYHVSTSKTRPTVLLLNKQKLKRTNRMPLQPIWFRTTLVCRNAPHVIENSMRMHMRNTSKFAKMYLLKREKPLT